MIWYKWKSEWRVSAWHSCTSFWTLSLSCPSAIRCLSSHHVGYSTNPSLELMREFEDSFYIPHRGQFYCWQGLDGANSNLQICHLLLWESTSYAVFEQRISKRFDNMLEFSLSSRQLPYLRLDGLHWFNLGSIKQTNGPDVHIFIRSYVWNRRFYNEVYWFYRMKYAFANISARSITQAFLIT